MNKKLVIFVAVFIAILLTGGSVVLAATSTMTPGWIEVQSDGFGNVQNSIQSTEVFNGYIYAGTWSYVVGSYIPTASIWRAADGRNWSNVSPTWPTTTYNVMDLQVFNSHLYAAVDGIWRSSDGTTWEQVAEDHFGETSNGINALMVFSNTIFAATDNQTTGIEIWSSTTGNIGDWAQANTDGFGYGATGQDITMDVYNENLYVGFNRSSSGIAELWRSNNGTTWYPVFRDGLGNPNNSYVSAMEEFNGNFYIAFRNVISGGELWRSSNGTDWNTIFINGNGDSYNQRPYGLATFNNRLYLLMSNYNTGGEVWESTDGSSWQIIADNGWNDTNTSTPCYFDKCYTEFNNGIQNGLYIGTHNGYTGGKIWLYLYLPNKVYLPLIIR